MNDPLILLIGLEGQCLLGQVWRQPFPSKLAPALMQPLPDRSAHTSSSPVLHSLATAWSAVLGGGFL